MAVRPRGRYGWPSGRSEGRHVRQLEQRNVQGTAALKLTDQDGRAGGVGSCSPSIGQPANPYDGRWILLWILLELFDRRILELFFGPVHDLE